MAQYRRKVLCYYSCEMLYLPAEVKCFRVLIKQLSTADNKDGFKYEWYEMTFISTRSIHGPDILLYMDVPIAFSRKFEAALAASRSPRLLQSVLEEIVINVLVEMYHDSIWTMRGHIRQIEKVRQVQ